MEKINESIEKFVTYLYDNEEEYYAHVVPMENKGYEAIEQMANSNIVIKYRKVLD